MRQVYRERLIIAGNVAEHYQYGKVLVKGETNNASGRAVEASDANKERHRTQTLRKAQNQVRRLINANWTASSVFVTLTYAENLQDLDRSHQLLRDFIKRAKRNMPEKDWRYLAVPEFQKRGAIHYHVVFFGLGFLDHKVLAALWGHGYVKINRLAQCDNVGAYVGKYMTKEASEALRGRYCFLRSRGLVDAREVL